MKIETKFDVGQQVYVYKDGIITHTAIKDYKLIKSGHSLPKDVVYRIEYVTITRIMKSFDILEGDRFGQLTYYESVDEKDIFATKQDLINHLNETL